jgi:hypothetical protein
MAIHPGGEGFGVPAASDAERILRDIAPVSRRSRRLTREAAVARPLLAWGLAWMAGTVLFQYVPGPVGAIAGSVPCAGAAAVTWLLRSRDVRLPTERQFMLLWFGFLASSPFLVAVAAPANARLMAVFLTSLWAVGMVLYGIGMQDVPLGLVGAAIVATAAATRLAAPGAAMLIVGTGGGLAMALLGSWRMWGTRAR